MNHILEHILSIIIILSLLWDSIPEEGMEIYNLFTLKLSNAPANIYNTMYLIFTDLVNGIMLFHEFN